MIIEDGSGKGYKVKVNSENRLNTDSNVRSMISHVSMDEEQSYMAMMPLTTVSGSGGHMFSLKNTRSGDNGKFTLSKTLLFWNGGDVTGTSVLEATLSIGTYAPTDGHIESTLVNFNLGSGNVADFDYYYWDGSTGTGMTMANGNPGPQFIIDKGMNDISVDEAMIIPYNYTISLSVTPPEVGRFSAVIHGYYGDHD
jgi:hypothetical protein